VTTATPVPTDPLRDPTPANPNHTAIPTTAPELRASDRPTPISDDPTATPTAAATPTSTPTLQPITVSGGVGGGGGTGLIIRPAQTPELGSLLLFGSGAAGTVAYALARLRRRD
jgi:hypothetical protein